jgi:outer membrane protein OmpA-like peptidoglycan-associated protein
MRRSLLFAILPLGLLLAACHVVGPEHFVVFFSPWSANLDANGKQVVDRVGAYARQRPGAAVTVNGYASTVGPADANQTLSEQRTKTVVDAIVAAGVSPNRIARQSHGAVDYTLDPIESRRVEITVGER